MRYILVKDGIVQDAIELDPANINDGTPCPRELLHIVPQPDKVTPQPDLIEPQPDIVEIQPAIQKVDDDGKPEFDEDDQPIMIAQPDKITKQHDIITPQPALIEPQPDIELDGRYKAPEGCELIASELGNPGDAYPLIAPVIDPNEAILEQIRVAEAGISDRRLREAILGTDNGWLAGVNKQIADLRGQLK